jgi:hypothetical protein
MPDGRVASRPRRGRRLGATAGTAMIALAIGLAACSDDDDDAAPDSVLLEITDSTEPVRIDVTPPLELSASADPDFLAEILADDTVTVEEVTDAYERYIECLADGGAVGVYAFDLDLRVAFADWSLPDASGTDKATLDGSCKRDFVGDLITRFNDANPPAADLAERQRASMIACVESIDPAVAAEIPDVVTLDTTEQGVSVVELQLDATALGADSGEVDAVNRCIGALGAATLEFS